MVNDFARDHVAEIFPLAVSLESDPDDLIAEKDGSTAVAGIDCGIQLHSQQIPKRMCIQPVFDPGNDPLGHGKTVAADRIADRQHFGLKLGCFPDFKRRNVIVKFRLLDPQGGEVAVMIDEFDFCRVNRVGIVLTNHNHRTVGDIVGIGQYPSIFDHHPGTAALVHNLLPRGKIIGRGFMHFQFDDAVERIVFRRKNSRCHQQHTSN